LIRVVGMNKTMIRVITVMVIALESTVVKGDVICAAPDLN